MAQGRHPAVDLHLCALLESINERLGGGQGADIAPLDTSYLDDLLALAEDEARRQEEEEEARR